MKMNIDEEHIHRWALNRGVNLNDGHIRSCEQHTHTHTVTLAKIVHANSYSLRQPLYFVG